jgi:hypothetical protein
LIPQPYVVTARLLACYSGAPTQARPGIEKKGEDDMDAHYLVLKPDTTPLCLSTLTSVNVFRFLSLFVELKRFSTVISGFIGSFFAALITRYSRQSLL